MVGIEPPGLDSLPEGPGRDLVLALHSLYRGAGKPSTRQIAKDVNNGDYRDTVSHETVAAMLHGDRGLPRWEKLESVVSVLALRHTPPLDPVAEASRMQEFWHAAQGHSSLSETARNTTHAPDVTLWASSVIATPPASALDISWLTRRRSRILLGAGSTAVLIAVVAAIVAFTSNPGSSRLPVQPLAGYPGVQLQAVQIPVKSLQGKLAQMFGQSGTASVGTITGYEFRNASNESAPVCLGAVDTGATTENRDPVQVLSCNNHELNEIWIPAQWEQNHQRLTWLVNGKYQSMCLNVNATAGRGTHAQLWNCYYNPNKPDGLAFNEAWDFGAWYANMRTGINPYPIFLGTGDFCLDADNENADPSKNNELPNNTEVTMWDYYHVARNQYWS